MSKLTVIEQATEYLELCQKRMVYDESTHIIGCLLSLLEEKDKALEVLADKSNWFEVTDRENTFSVLLALKAWAWMDQRLPWTIARKALNTSSNNEGEI